MKLLSTIVLLSVLPIATSFAAQGGVTAAGDRNAAEAEIKPNEGCPLCSKEKVKPGESHTNGDGVTVDNDEDSSGNATIDPENGEEGDETTVDTDTGFEGDIDSNDTVDLGSSNDVDVSGTGGTVNVGGGSNVDITNTSGAGGTSITVNLPSGTTLTVGPGSTVNINNE